MLRLLSNPTDVPAPPAAYSHAAHLQFADANFLILSGQIALGADGSIVGEGDMSIQTETIFGTVNRILASHGASFDDVVNVRTYLVDMSQLPAYGAVRRRFLGDTNPTSTTIEVSRLFRAEALVEVEVTAAWATRPA